MPTYRTVFMSHAHVDNIICERYAAAAFARAAEEAGASVSGEQLV